MNEDYFQYLTKKLEEGISSNPIVGEIKNTIIDYARSNKNYPVKILDLGCFSGTVCHCVYQKLPVGIRSNSRFVGFDNNREALLRGIKSYPELIFVKGDLTMTRSLPFLPQFKIVFLSNVLHEIYSDYGKKVVLETIKEAQRVLLPGGKLIILEGIKPCFPKHKIIVEFKTNKNQKIFQEFQKKYKAFSIQGKFLPNKRLKSDWLSITAFMTKARYLKTSYWGKESEENYQFFSENDFLKALRDMKNFVFKPQCFLEEELLFRFINEKISITKNTLIISTK